MCRSPRCAHPATGTDKPGRLRTRCGASFSDAARRGHAPDRGQDFPVASGTDRAAFRRAPQRTKPPRIRGHRHGCQFRSGDARTSRPPCSHPIQAGVPQESGAQHLQIRLFARPYVGEHARSSGLGERVQLLSLSGVQCVPGLLHRLTRGDLLDVDSHGFGGEGDEDQASAVREREMQPASPHHRPAVRCAAPVTGFPSHRQITGMTFQQGTQQNAQGDVSRDVHLAIRATAERDGAGPLLGAQEPWRVPGGGPGALVRVDEPDNRAPRGGSSYRGRTTQVLRYGKRGSQVTRRRHTTHELIAEGAAASSRSRSMVRPRRVATSAASSRSATTSSASRAPASARVRPSGP